MQVRIDLLGCAIHVKKMFYLNYVIVDHCSPAKEKKRKNIITRNFKCVIHGGIYDLQIYLIFINMQFVRLKNTVRIIWFLHARACRQASLQIIRIMILLLN